MFRTFVTLAALSSVLACPEHDFNTRATDRGSYIGARADSVNKGNDWNYDDPSIWGSIKPEYAVCSSGKTQSPIALSGTKSTVQKPVFNYTTPVTGALSNWGYGPSFALDKQNGKDVLDNPMFTTAEGLEKYLSSWHLHIPSEHTINGAPAKAEIHLVHTDSTGAYAGVLGIPINIGAASKFLAPVLAAVVPAITSSATVAMADLDMSTLISEGGNFKSYWTYSGSLTLPPCTEGLRWWVSGTMMTVSQAQFDAISKVSEYSNRGVQEILDQNVGQ